LAHSGVVSPAEIAYSRTPRPAASTPWRDAEFSVIDLETTGLDSERDEIISYAAVQIADGRVRLNDVRYQRIRPRRMPDGETIRIHGLRRADLVDAPPLHEVLDGLLEAMTGKALVAHFAEIERSFLSAALYTRGLKLVNPIIDTTALAAELFRRRGRPLDSGSIGLSQLARNLGLPVHRPHHADGDALTTAQVFLALATHLDALEPQTVGSLQRITKRVRGSPIARPPFGRVVARLSRRVKLRRDGA
jgi:DNA polymerase-3 subunit epsilon